MGCQQNHVEVQPKPVQLQVALAAHNMNSHDLWTCSIFIAFQESSNLEDNALSFTTNCCKWFLGFAEDKNLLKDGREDYYRMKRKVKMNKLLTCYCDRMVLDYSSTLFLIEGDFFPHNKTPDEILQAVTEKRMAPIWFTLLASDTQEGHAPLSQMYLHAI